MFGVGHKNKTKIWRVKSRVSDVEDKLVATSGEGWDKHMGLRDTNCDVKWIRNKGMSHSIRKYKLLFCNNFKWSINYANTESL